MKIEILCGMIASGKSTYARRRAEQGALVIAHDGLVAMLHAEYRYEQDLRALYRESEEALAAIALRHCRDVVIDRTHLTRESRQRWIGFLKNLMLPARIWRDDPPKVIVVAFPIESAGEHALRRFDADPRDRSYADWLAVARHHAGQAAAEPLDWEAEGFDRIVPWSEVPR